VSGVSRIGLLIFVAAILQVAVFWSVEIVGGTPDLVLVTLISIALLRGSITGAAAGFAGGLLVDIGTLGTLGITSLLLTVAGYWAGRYGETTGRDRPHAPPLALVVITLFAGVAAYALHYMLGEEISARHALITTLLPAVVLNVVVGMPVYVLCRAMLRQLAAPQRAKEVELLV